ncbi:MAG TPA: PEP-CTERM sorting domain-containing protein [Rhodopila sp.]|jgi:hypothetical protein
MGSVRLLAAAAAFGVAAAFVPHARATLIVDIGGSVAPGGVITGGTIAGTDATNTLVSLPVSADGSFVDSVTLEGVNAFGGNGVQMAISALDVSASGSGSLSLFFIETGLTGPSPVALSVDFSASTFTNIAVTRSVFFDPTDTGMESQLLFASTGPGGSVGNVPVSFNSTYALVEEIDLTAIDPGATLAAFNQVSSVPEPMSLALVGSGLFGLAFVRRRRRGLMSNPAP